MNKNDNPFLNPEWLDLQRRYLDALKNFGSPAGGEVSRHGGYHIWTQMLDNWWRSVSPGLPSEYRTGFNHILRQSQTFYSILDQFARLLSEVAAVKEDDDEWQNILSRHFELMRRELFKPEYSTSGDAGMYSWVSPFTIWQQMLSGMPHVPSDAFKETKTDEVENFFQKLLALPGADQYTAEYQEKIRNGVKLWQDFYDKSREYHAIYEKVGISALGLLEKKILELGRQGGKITSLRELYNLWVDCNEEAFSEYMAEDHSPKIYSEIVNLLMEIKTHYIELMDEIFTLYNLPTARTMDTVYKSQHEMNRELNQARKHQEEAAAEIEKLKRELDILRKQLPTSTKNKSKSTKAGRKKK